MAAARAAQAFASATLAIASASQASDSGAARASPLALSCTGCHQVRGHSPAIPALNALSPAGIAAALRRSRDAPAFGSIMARLTSSLSDADIDELATQLGRSKRSR